MGWLSTAVRPVGNLTECCYFILFLVYLACLVRIGYVLPCSVMENCGCLLNERTSLLSLPLLPPVCFLLTCTVTVKSPVVSLYLFITDNNSAMNKITYKHASSAYL